MRRVIALGVGVLILILLLLGVRGCLNARKERGENYVSDLDGIVDQSNQLSQEFFGRLEDPPRGLAGLQLEAEITTDRGTAESLLQRVEGLDVPDELSDAQDLLQSFELRTALPGSPRTSRPRSGMRGATTRSSGSRPRWRPSSPAT